jgi:inhibitor of cysteine peptidase
MRIIVHQAKARERLARNRIEPAGEKPMKHFAQIAAALCLVALAIGSGPAEAKSGKSLRVGQSWQFQFEGNPSTGFKWRLNAGASKGLNAIKLQTIGYASGGKKRGRIGAPAPFAFRLTCVKPGSANLRFAYIGPTGKRSSKRQSVSLRCN